MSGFSGSNTGKTGLADGTTAQKLDLATQIAGERNPDSATNSYLAFYGPANVSILATASVTVTIGAGAANDTHMLGYVLLTHTAAVTLTVTGFYNSSTAATSVTFTGSTSADTIGDFGGLGLINAAGALTAGANVAAKAIVFWRPT